MYVRLIMLLCACMHPSVCLKVHPACICCAMRTEDPTSVSRTVYRCTNGGLKPQSIYRNEGGGGGGGAGFRRPLNLL